MAGSSFREDGGNVDLWNVDTLPQNYAAMTSIWNGNESSGTTKGGEFLNDRSDCWLLKKNCFMGLVSYNDSDG